MHAIEMKIEGFNYPYPPYGGLSFHSLSSASAESQFKAFVKRVYKSLGNSFLPIYRMADGEFAFLLGWRAPFTKSKRHGLSGSLHQMLGSVLRLIDQRTTTTTWGEAYTHEKKKLALIKMENSIKYVSDKGILALYFYERPDTWGEQYFAPMCNWFEAHNIVINVDNYVPFYFVYALLNGPARKFLYSEKHVLVVTSLSEKRRNAISASLYKEGAASVQFLGISANNSMFDEIDLSTIHRPIDFALIAAGIGSVNILQQLESLAVPCIDCGICIECLIEPERRHERPFLMEISDNDTTVSKLPFISKKCL